MVKLRSIWEIANPQRFMQVTRPLVPAAAAAAALFLAVGLAWGFFFTAVDYKQGASVKIIFLHVPSAMMAVNIWLMMLAASLVWLIRRHYVSALAAKAAAPIGATMTLVAMATGAIWGEITWGTWWAWDPKLTSFLVLLLFYAGYICLWLAVDSLETAADLTSITCMFGSVFALLSRYAVNFWSQGLHQGSSLSLDEAENVHNAYYIPLVICIAGFVFLFVALLLLRTRTEIRERRIAALLQRRKHG